MTTLKDWIDAHAKRPLAFAVGTVLCLQAAFLLRMAEADYSAQLRRMARVVETASLGIQQENRSLVESALLAGLHDSDAAAVALCRAGQADILYPPSAPALCGARSKGFLRWTVRRKIAGMPGLEFAFLVDGRRTFASAAFVTGITAVLLFVVVAILVRARRRFQDEVLEPLYNGLTAGGPLGISELDELRRRNQEFHALSRRQAASEARFQLSVQVAHDICSPLAALDTIFKDLSQLPEKRRLLLLGAAGRIRGIAENLLEKNWKSKDASQGAEPVCTTQLSSLIEPLIQEKRVQFRSKACVKIDFQADPGSDGLTAKVQPVEFQRMLSNLINNAVEAVGEQEGTVTASLASAAGKVLLKVQDDGKGIPAAVLARLCRRGETHGKAKGSGLGLHHAKTCAQSWGGSLEIDSEPGAGTCVTVRLPKAAELKTGPDVVLLDDEPLVRMNWEVAAESKGLSFAAYKQPAEFLAAAAHLPKETAIYLDSDLGEGIQGEAIAKDLHARGFSNLHLATGHAPDLLPAMPWIKQVGGKEPPWN
jgi:signal transduction histidine kinase